MAVRRGIGVSVVSEIEFIPHPNLRTLKVSNADIFTHAQVACLEERKGKDVGIRDLERPKIKVSVRIGNSQEVQDRLFDYSVDVAVLAHIGDDPHIWTKPYSRHPVVVFVNTDHPWAKRTSISIEELDGQKMVLREIGSMTRRAFEMAIEEAKVHIDLVMEIGSREAVWMAVRRGIGVSVVSEIEFIPHPNLRTLKVSNADIFTHAQVACLEERKGTHLIQAFLKVVDELVQIRSVSEE